MNGKPRNTVAVSDYIRFLTAFATHPGRVGAVAPSSSLMAERMVDWIDWPNVRNVIEYGSGTGAFTRAILSYRRPGSEFFAIESDEKMVTAFRKKFPHVNVYCDTAANVRELCDRQQIETVDAIVCGLPWSVFSPELQTELMDATMSVLRPGGQFTTFAYLQGVMLPAGRRFRDRLHDCFSSVEKSRTVWRNFPPAFVYRCRR